MVSSRGTLWTCDSVEPRAGLGLNGRVVSVCGWVTRFVTGTLCHAVVLGENAETAASPAGCSPGTSAVGMGPGETAACPRITQRS